MQFRTLLRRAATAMTMAVAAGAVAVTLGASPAGAHHEVCANETPPGDIGTAASIVGVVTVFAGVDTGLNNVPLGSARVCLAVGGTTIANTHWSTGIVASDADPGRIGIQEKYDVCLGGSSCLTVLYPTGIELGLPNVYTGSNIVCVGTICLTDTTIDPNTDLYVNGAVIPVPCIRVGPTAPACP